jgi:hypothetical protein
MTEPSTASIDASVGPLEGGRRRIDRVLSDSFLDGLGELPLDEVRTRRSDAEQEEADLSYVRRLLQGRLDILRAELARRSEGGDQGSLVDQLAAILSDGPTPAPHGLGRHVTVEPSRVDEHRRAVEQLVADVGISDVVSLDDDGLRQAQARIENYERAVSRNRRRVQKVMDTCTAEIARRYKSGEASVDDLLPEG